LPREGEQRAWLSQPASPTWRRGFVSVVLILLGIQAAIAAVTIIYARSVDSAARSAPRPVEPPPQTTVTSTTGMRRQTPDEEPVTIPPPNSSDKDAAVNSGADAGAVDSGADAGAAVSGADAGWRDGEAAAPDLQDTLAAGAKQKPPAAVATVARGEGIAKTAAKEKTIAGKGSAGTATAKMTAARRSRPRDAASRSRSSQRRREERTTSQEPPVPPDRRPARLSVKSDPSAEVLIDGRPRGQTPISALELGPGRHRLRLTRAGMQPYESTLTLESGQTHAVQVALKPKAAPPPEPTKQPKAPRTTPAKPKQEREAQREANPAPEGRVPRAIPHLALPASVRVVVYDEGKPSNQVMLVCLAVEKAVSRAMGVSASGTTRALQNYLLAKHEGEDYIRVKVYPRAMGYMIAQSLSQAKGGVGGRVRDAHRSGRLASLTASGWKP
jgi:hypothetical protein